MLRNLVAGNRPALIHAHFGPDACNAIGLAQALDLQLVTTFHGYDVTTSDKHLPLVATSGGATCWKQFGAKFICVSEFIRQRAIEEGFPAAQDHRSLHGDRHRPVLSALDCSAAARSSFCRPPGGEEDANSSSGRWRECRKSSRTSRWSSSEMGPCGPRSSARPPRPSKITSSWECGARKR